MAVDTSESGDSNSPASSLTTGLRNAAPAAEADARRFVERFNATLDEIKRTTTGTAYVVGERGPELVTFGHDVHLDGHKVVEAIERKRRK